MIHVSTMKDNMGNLRCYDGEIVTVKVWYSKQQLCACIPLFGTFLSVAANFDLKFPNSRFCKGLELTTTLFSNCLSLKSVLKKPPLHFTNCLSWNNWHDTWKKVNLSDFPTENNQTKESLWLLTLTACSPPFLLKSVSFLSQQRDCKPRR